jgi:hypothetical protein
MNTLTRILSRIACFANCHPHVVLALVFASIVAVVGLGIAGAVSLVTAMLFAVITLAMLVVIQRYFTRG